MIDELFYREMPKDAETERRTLCALLVVDKSGHEAFGKLDKRDFCLGSMGFNGWLFERIRSGRQVKGSTVAYLLRAKHKRRAAELGVGNLALELARLAIGPDSRYRPGQVRLLPQYVSRLKDITKRRRRIWDAEQAYQRAWNEWDDNERRRGESAAD